MGGVGVLVWVSHVGVDGVDVRCCVGWCVDVGGVGLGGIVR